MTPLLEAQVPKTTEGEPPRVLVPEPATVFQRRARRLERLADGHALGGWLQFLSCVAAAQQVALDNFPDIPLPGEASLALAREHAMPPVAGQSWPRDKAWHDALVRIAGDVYAEAPAPARIVLEALTSIPDAELEALAETVLRQGKAGAEVAALPFVAAALQVYWTAMAARLGAGRLQPLDVPGVCPCCGTLPVASVIHPGGLRYLHCALCGVEWNLVRVKCAACNGTAGIAYYEIEGGRGVVRAESCESCRSYLKLVRRDLDADADPVADDLATLALDLLVDAAGYRRSGPNLLLFPGTA